MDHNLIPEDLEESWERIVESLFKGNEDRAIENAIRLFVEKELKRLPSGKKFDHIIGERLGKEKDFSGYSKKELSSAFQKLENRKKKLESFDFSKIKKDALDE